MAFFDRNGTFGRNSTFGRNNTFGELKKVELEIDVLYKSITNDEDLTEQMKNISKSLEKLKKDIDTIKKTDPLISNSMFYNFKLVVAKFVKLSNDYKNYKNERLIARGTIVLGLEKEDEIRKKVNENPTHFLSELSLAIKDPAHEALTAYTDALSRGRDIDKLVYSINEVSDMMKWLAILVQEQSEKLDSIESHVEIAQIHIEKGNNNLKSSIQTQKKTRKCYCYLICIVVALIIALAIGLGVAFRLPS